jgi:ribosomal protein S18 acetylase RimI-like enzyme
MISSARRYSELTNRVPASNIPRQWIREHLGLGGPLNTVATVSIRPAVPADAPTIVQLVRELAEYEREPLANVRITETDVLRDGFGPERRFECLLAEIDGRAAGFALFLHNYSTWLGRAGIHVEDIYVSEWARGSGLGRRLLAAVAAAARARGCRRVDLSVLHWNPARAFYERIGFKELSEWRPYRLADESLDRLAAEAATPIDK